MIQVLISSKRNTQFELVDYFSTDKLALTVNKTKITTNHRYQRTFGAQTHHIKQKVLFIFFCSFFISWKIRFIAFHLLLYIKYALHLYSRLHWLNLSIVLKAFCSTHLISESVLLRFHILYNCSRLIVTMADYEKTHLTHCTLHFADSQFFFHKLNMFICVWKQNNCIQSARIASLCSVLMPHMSTKFHQRVDSF